MNNPCVKDCPYRSPVCHAECEAYALWAEERKRSREQISAARQKMEIARDTHYRRVSREFKKYKKKPK